MYIAKITGTKYICSLESVKGSWVLRLKLGDISEAEVNVDELTSKELLAKLDILFRQVNLQINKFQIELIHKEIMSQITHLLVQDGRSPHEPTKKEEGEDDITREDPRVDELLDKVRKLERMVDTLQHRLERIEAMSSKE